MHKNEQSKQSKGNDENQITSFNETHIDPAQIVTLDELDEASLAQVSGGKSCDILCQNYKE